MAIKTVKLGDVRVKAIGYGCMGLSQAYEPCSEEQSVRTLNAVLDMGYDHLDTAALYGFGKNEELLNKAIDTADQSTFWLPSVVYTEMPAVNVKSMAGRTF